MFQKRLKSCFVTVPLYVLLDVYRVRFPYGTQFEVCRDLFQTNENSVSTSLTYRSPTPPVT